MFWSLLLSMAASAATYDVELHIPATPILPPAGATEPLYLESPRPLVDTTLPDQVVSTAHPNFTCEIRDGVINAVFSAESDAWPSTLPTSVSCSHGADTLVIHPVVSQPPGKMWELSSGFIAPMGRQPGTPRVDSWLLPAGLAYTSASVAASGITDVQCTVMNTHTPGRLGLKVELEATTTAGIGTCSLPLSGGGTFDVQVAVVDQ